MTSSKRRSGTHIIDQDAQELVKKVLPKPWVLREYRPDYGIDYGVEVFVPTPDDADQFETLGEHFFIQLKGIRKSPPRQSVELYSRQNVEKGELNEDRNDLIGEMEVIGFQLEIEELVTVQRMGPALPVLLVLADLEQQKCFFVCLNDFIDKLLVPKHPDYTVADSRVVHVPVWNDLSSIVGANASRWYAKRAKLYGAFQKFVYQHAELGYATSPAEVLRLSQHFVRLLLQWDFWSTTEMWEPLKYYGDLLKGFATSGDPGLRTIDRDKIKRAADNDPAAEAALLAQLNATDCVELWRCLSVLPRTYEEVCREWFLPTWLGYEASYPASLSK